MSDATGAPRRQWSRPWRLGESSWAFLSFAAAVEIVVILWLADVLPALRASSEAWLRLALLAGLALAYEESGKRLARLQVRLGSDLTYEMTSVWGVAAAVALPLGMSALLLFSLGFYAWWRRDRHVGRPLHRPIFNTSNAVLTSLVGGVLFYRLIDAFGAWPRTLSAAIPCVIAIIIYSATNRLLATVALLTLGIRDKTVIVGSIHDNLVEFATLCLGGLVAVALLYEPWLAVLAIAPMVSMRRGAMVHELEAAATTDSKTGLYNAVTWERIAQRELTRGERTATSTAILIVDLDRFKMVNDVFGHLAGDKVLRGIGERLRSEVREYDTVGRFGGEEFVAVLPNADDADALVVAERLRSRINDLSIADLIDEVAHGSERDARIAASIGVACSSHDGAELTDLLYAADAALYRAKNLGRNRVILAERGGDTPERVTAR